MSPKSPEAVVIKTDDEKLVNPPGEPERGEERLETERKREKGRLTEEQWLSLEDWRRLRDVENPGWFSFAGAGWYDRYGGVWEVANNKSILNQAVEHNAKEELGIVKYNKDKEPPVQTLAWSVLYCPPDGDDFFPIRVIYANLPSQYTRTYGEQGQLISTGEMIGTIVSDAVVGDWFRNTDIVLVMREGAQADMRLFPDHVDSFLPLAQKPQWVIEKEEAERAEEEARKLGNVGVKGEVIFTAVA